MLTSPAFDLHVELKSFGVLVKLNTFEQVEDKGGQSGVKEEADYDCGDYPVSLKGESESSKT